MVVSPNECLILSHSGALAARAGARGAPSGGGRGSAGGDAKILQTKAEGLWERRGGGGILIVTTGGSVTVPEGA